MRELPFFYSQVPTHTLFLFVLFTLFFLLLLSFLLSLPSCSFTHPRSPFCHARTHRAVFPSLPATSVCVVCRRAGQRFEPPPAVGSRRVTLCVHSLHLRLQRRQVTSMTPWRPPPSPPSTRLPGPDVHRPCTLLPGYAS